MHFQHFVFLAYALITGRYRGRVNWRRTIGIDTEGHTRTFVADNLGNHMFGDAAILQGGVRRSS
jgi:hypothetical protein